MALSGQGLGLSLVTWTSGNSTGGDGSTYEGKGKRGAGEKHTNKQTHDQREQTQTTPRRKINKTTDKQGREIGLKIKK